jgi:hypothetical protein
VFENSDRASLSESRFRTQTFFSVIHDLFGAVRGSGLVGLVFWLSWLNHEPHEKEDTK